MSEGTPQPEKRPLPNRRDSQPNTFYARAAAEARRMRRTMNRELLISYAKTLFWTIPLTILIWVYAERQQAKTAQLTIEIGVRIDDPKKSATLIAPDPPMIICTVTGPQSQVDALSDELNGRPPSPIMLSIDANTPIKDNSIPTLGKIQDAEIFRSHGLTVVSASPSVLEILVDSMDEKSVAVVPPDQLNGKITTAFSPPRVKIRGPRHFLQDIETVQADMSAPASGAPTTQRVTVPLKPFPESRGITVSPDSVEASLALAAPQASTVVTKVIVYETLVPRIASQYKIDVTPPSIDVPITGPEDVINKIIRDRNSYDIRAEVYFPGVEVKDSDKVPIQIIGLPDGVHVASDTPLTVKITATLQ